MTIAVIAAMNKEVKLLLQQIENYRENKFEDFSVYEGQLNNHRIFIAQCGIGKVNSALRTLKLIEIYKPDLIINSGVAGGLDAHMHIGDVLAADNVAYHDVWCGPGTQYGRADGCPLFFKPDNKVLDILRHANDEVTIPLKFGLLCSGDQFISSATEVKQIKSHFPDALGCDMESASIAQTCFLNDVPFAIIRVMSDNPGQGENISQYQNFWSEAPEKNFNILKLLIERI